MENTVDTNVKNLVRSSLLLALIIVSQTIGSKFPPVVSQFVVGSIVNAILLLIIFVCGKWWAVGVGCLTPILAWSLGQLPPAFGPFIPFIMIGNSIYICFVALLISYKPAGKYLGILAGAFAKFLFLFLSAEKLIVIFNLSIPAALTKKLITLMSYPQLITALIGGLLVLFLTKILSARIKLH